MKLRMLGAIIAACTLVACGGKGDDKAATAAAGGGGEKSVNVYNWSDYIAEDTIPNFEKQTGIKVTYDVFDSNEVLETKLLAGASGYDVVVPTLNFLGRQIQAGVFLPLDKSKIPNYANLDPEMMKTPGIAGPGQQVRDPLHVGHHRHRLQRRQGQGRVRQHRRHQQPGPGVQAREHRQAQGLRGDLPGYAFAS